jgi:hypothetical protein
MYLLRIRGRIAVDAAGSLDRVSRFPNLLVNGADAIALRNFGEIVAAVPALRAEPEADADDSIVTSERPDGVEKSGHDGVIRQIVDGRLPEVVDVQDPLTDGACDCRSCCATVPPGVCPRPLVGADAVGGQDPDRSRASAARVAGRLHRPARDELERIAAEHAANGERLLISSRFRRLTTLSRGAADHWW